MKLLIILFTVIAGYFTIPAVVQTQFMGVAFEDVTLPLQEKPVSWGLDTLDATSVDNLEDRNIQISHTGAGVDVYVLDTGVVSNKDNPDLKLWMNFTQEANTTTTECDSHGTMMSSIIAGVKDGVAKEANIINFKVLTCDQSLSNSDDIIEALNWILVNHNRDVPAVINLSLGVSGDTNGISGEFKNVISQLENINIPVIAAAGNDSVDACTATPASTPNAITVGAYKIVDKKVYISDVSNNGSCVDLYAPGQEVNTYSSDGSEYVVSGTSAATAYVSGVVSLYLQEHPTATVYDVETWLTENAYNTSINYQDKGSFEGNLLHLPAGY